MTRADSLFREGTARVYQAERALAALLPMQALDVRLIVVEGTLGYLFPVFSIVPLDRDSELLILLLGPFDPRLPPLGALLRVLQLYNLLATICLTMVCVFY